MSRLSNPNLAPKLPARSWRIAAVLAGLAALALWFWSGDSKIAEEAVFQAKRGPLSIAVLEGGSIEALESQEIRSEVKGYQGTKILSIVEEGYLVTEEDVRNQKILIELDSSEIEQRMVTQEIQFESTVASLTEAQQGYEIQLNQNESDIKAAEQAARFSKMDVEKFLGDTVTREILGLIESHHLNADAPGVTNEIRRLDSSFLRLPAVSPVQFAADTTAGAGQASDVRAPMPVRPRTGGPDGARGSGNGPRGGGPRDPRSGPPAWAERPDSSVSEPSLPSVATPLPVSKPSVSIDYSKYAKAELLGDGEANQRLRKLEDDYLVAQSELNLAETKYLGTERLHGKGFVTKAELDNEKLAVEKSKLKVQTAETAWELFKKYEFPKSAEEFVSKYEESLRGLERARKEAVSRLAQAQAKLRSSESRFRIEQKQKQEIEQQFKKCVIRAQKPGLVVYGGGGDDRRFGEEPIREGTAVRERQPLITIPDMTKMGVNVKIHESHIKKVTRGMRARIRVDAFPNEELLGEVIKVAVLPDSANRWMSPDLKVYATSVRIDKVHEWLKPGMSAKVEVLVTEHPDVVYVPVQAVNNLDGRTVCYVMKGRTPEERVVEVGDFNDEFIVIKKGIREGERILLRSPETPAAGFTPDSEEEKQEEAPPADGPAAVAS